MTPFTENNSFDSSVNSYDTTDPVQGGPGGAANNPLQSLVNRTRWLYEQITSILEEIGLLAPLNSPALTGTPTAPTPAPDDNSTKVATTAFVDAAISGLGGGGSSNPTSSKSASAGWRWDPRDGYLEQWGEVDQAVTAEGSFAYQFPVLFTTCLGHLPIALDPGNATDSTHLQRGSYTTSSGSFRVQDDVGGNAANAAGVAWRAWGYSTASPSPNSAYTATLSSGYTLSGGNGLGGGGGGAEP